MSIKEVRRRIQAGMMRWTEHAMQRLIKRSIAKDEVAQSLVTGAIIERYPDDYPYPSCLILGRTIKGEHLHVVCGLGEPDLWVVTAYRPDPVEWSKDFKVRKEEKK
jgi:hypothetical protein